MRGIQPLIIQDGLAFHFVGILCLLKIKFQMRVSVKLLALKIKVESNTGKRESRRVQFFSCYLQQE